ncbi:MAG: PA14 domain-containing protein, partial [Bacteroidales bacterium]
MKKILSLIASFIFSGTIYAQFVNVEAFAPWPQSNFVEVPTSNAYTIDQIDSLETSTFGQYRIRGYLVPPLTGYYRFHLLSADNTCFYLSLDSMDYHRRQIINSQWLLPGSPPLTWPDTIPTLAHTNLTSYKDSVYLSQDKPYYFEIFNDYPRNASHYGLKWTLPGTNQLTSIKGTHLRPAIPLHAGSNIDWNIFENEFSYNFEQLKNSELLPDKKVSLQSMTTYSLQNTRDHYSSKVRGYIYPDVSGNYVFYFACNDVGQFWLSTDSTETNAQLITDITSAQTNWILSSSTHPLVGGKKYFFEILHHDSVGSDLIKLGWTLQGDTIPGIITFSKLSGYLVSVAATQVKFSADHVSLLKNQSYASLCNIVPWNAKNKILNWMTTNPSVATVDGDGLIKAVGSGECSIIAWLNSNPTIADTLFLNVNRIEWELFKDRPTVNFDSLRNSYEPPDQIIEITELNTTDYMSTLDFYSSRIRGYLIPPVSGTYAFYFSCDDEGQFWLSPDSIPGNAMLKSIIDSSDYDSIHYISYQALSAGHKYFFELIQHDSVYKDKVKLCWLIPGDTVPVVISVPYLTGTEQNKPVNSFSLLDRELLAYPNWTFSPRYQITPWNATNKMILWESSNNAIASVSSSGEVTTVGSGICQIFARVVQDTTLIDTLQLNVTNYPGPYFVKTTAGPAGNGHSWDNPAELATLLNLLSRGDLPPQINVYATQGTYKPTSNLDRNKSFTLRNIRLVGGYPVGSIGTDTTNRDVVNYETILSGEIGATGTTMDNSYHVVATYSSSVIDGFTIRDGRANSKIYGDDNWYYFPENRGGGILALAEKTMIYNCKIQNNSAFDVAGGISLDGGQLIMQHCLVSGNLMQQTEIGGVQFAIYANGHGAGMRLIGITHIKDCIFENNRSWKAAFGAALASVNWGTVTTLENCTFNHNFSNSNADLMNWQGSTINLDNSTLIGSFVTAGWTTMNIKSSTIVGGGYVAFEDNHISIDNSIWTNPNLSFYPETTQNTWQAKFSILGDSLFGINKDELLSISLSAYTTWLDTLAYNGGFTPTMK